MANPVVEVLLRLKDELSGAAAKAAGGLKGLANEASDLLRNRLVQGVGLAGILQGLKSAWEASDRFEASLRALKGTAQITGTPLAILEDIAKSGTDTFKLSAVQSNAFATELAKLASKAGDVGSAKDGLAAFLDIGAAKGLTAEQTLTAVKQSILGIDEGTDKLFNKNPSVIYAEFADKIGTAAGKLTDQQKAQALLNAALEDGSKVRGEYVTWLDTAAGKTAQAGNATENAMVKLGQSTTTLRSVGLEALVALSEAAIGVVKTFQKVGVDLALLWDDIKATVTGNKQAKEQVEAIRREMYAEIEGITKSGEKKLTDAELKALTDRQVAAAEAAAARKAAEAKAAAEREQRAKDTAKALKDVEEELAIRLKMLAEGWTEAEAKEWVKRQQNMGRSLGVQVKTVKDGYDQIDRANLLLAAGFDQLVPKMKKTETTLTELKGSGVLPTTDAIDLLAKRLGVSREEAEKVGLKFSTSVKPSFDEVGRAAIGIGQALGVMDDKAAAALHNLVSIGESLGTGNVLGVIGGLSGILGSIFAGDRERLAMVKRNAEATEKLASVNGELLSLNTPGRKFAAVQSVFNDPGFAAAAEGATKPGGRKDLLFNLLMKNGLSMSDFLGVAKDLGYDFSGGFSMAGLNAFRAGVGQVQFSSYGNTFRDQLNRIGTGINIGAIGQGDELGQILGAVGAGGPNAILNALSGLDLSSAGGSASAVGNLRDLFNNIGSLSAADFGGLTGTEFVEAIQRIIGLLTDDVADVGGVLVPSSISTSQPAVPVVFDAIATETETQTGILTEIRDGITDLSDAMRRGSLVGVSGGSADEELGYRYRQQQESRGVVTL